MGADPNRLASDSTRTLLIIAIIQNEPELVSALLASGADVYAKDLEYYDPPIIWAADLAGPEIITLLLEAGADIASTDDTMGGTVLMWAAARNTAEVVSILLAYGADLTVRDT